jgi:membrane protein DedA with SNARE-associated domain
VLGVEDWLTGLPAGLTYVVVGVVILLESMGIPLPGEITLISAALLASAGAVNIVWVAAAAATGAIIGDSIGYAIGHRGGRALLARLGRRFPDHLGPHQVARAEQVFQRWGVWAVFFGRFVALLRILAGPMAGALRVPYRKFLLANASGGVVWAFGTALVVFYAGRAAQRWLHEFSWIALVVAVVAGIATTIYLRYRARRSAPAGDAQAEPAVTDRTAKTSVRRAGPSLANASNTKRRPTHNPSRHPYRRPSTRS